MENVNFSDINTDDERVKLFNRIIDNQNRIEGKVLQLIADNPKKKTKKKGGK